MAPESYERVPFLSRPIPWGSPAALAATSIVHGGPDLDPEGELSVLELGCGDGSHLLPLAFFHPNQRFVGVDTSERALALARDGAARLRLENLSFACEDLSTYTPRETFDVVLANGVYSWVGAERRAALRRLVSASLRDGGLAYVSFNAQPGWSVRRTIRDALLRERAGAGRDPLEAARERLEGLARLVEGQPSDPWSGLVMGELERARTANDGYLAHEYLAEHNAAFWLGDVVEDFARDGLTYVGDATFDRPEGFVPPEIRERARSLSKDPIRREEHIDLRLYRQLRAGVFTKGATVRGEGPPEGLAALVDRGWIAGAAHRRNDPFDISPGVVEPFDGPMGHELRIGSAGLKMALVLLADRYPEGLTLDRLRASCDAKLEALGVPRAERKLSDFRGAFTRLASELQVELRLTSPRLRLAPGPGREDRPLASALSRFEAGVRDVLTTPLHTLLPCEPLDAAIVTRLDGTQTREEVARVVSDAIVDGSIAVEGAPSDLERVLPWVEERVGATVTTLGWWGLCE